MNIVKGVFVLECFNCLKHQLKNIVCMAFHSKPNGSVEY